jgi:tetratricopeptide (TPR) repeat protein
VNAVLVILVSGTLLAAPGAEPNGSLDRAIALYRQGEFAASVALLQAARQAAPDDAETRLWLGKALLRVQKWNEAATELERAVALQPSNSRYHLHLGLAYGDKAMHASKLFAFGIARKVRDEFEAAVRVGPDDFEARSHLLEFYLEAPGLVGGGKDKARALVEQVAREIGASGVASQLDVAKVSIVGLGMRTHAGIAARMFEVLSAEGINIQMISTSEIKIAVVIDEKYVELAVRVLHRAFELDKAPAAS